MIFDSHAHYNSSTYDGDRDILLQQLFSDNVVGIVDCCAEPSDFKVSRSLSLRYPKIYSAYGLHPEALRDNEIDYLLQVVEKELPALLAEDKTVALGECGLDYYYDTDKTMQMQLFEAQLRLALQLDTPVLLHNRESHADMLAALKKYPIKGVMHCFSGSVEFMREIVKLGIYIGIGGIVTFNNAKVVKQVAKEVPLEMLLLETDCPYLAPQPHRGKRCDSGMISYTATAIAELKEIPVDVLYKQVLNNSKELFNIDRL